MAAERPVPPQKGEPGQADSPADLGKTGLKESLRRTVKEFKDDRATLTAAGMAFYWFLAIFPAMLAMVGILGLVNLSEEGVKSFEGAVESALPEGAAAILTDAVGKAGEQGGGGLVATLVGVALALWGASAGMVAMQQGLDVAYDVPQDRKFVKKRLVGMALVLVTGVLGGIATALIVFGAPIGEALRDNLPLGSAFVVLWTLVRWAVGIAALTLLFATYYFLAPNRETPKWVWVSPGGILAVLIWLAASLGFSFYVANFGGSYAETYGSLASVVVLLLWLYLSAIAVVMGGELNAELERQSAVQAAQIPDPETDRGAACDDPPPPPPEETAAAPVAETQTVRSSGSSDLQSAWAREARR
ncbi:MAG: YihY/virulence factor BrkB family protein [Actinomycetota bacterium]|nr:YihY/virulence factor BrkB family protein [Actinomycetota bacterium]